MEAKDLQLGDHLTYISGEHCIVNGLDAKGLIAVSFVDAKGKKQYSTLLPERDFEPIELTAEILEKNFDKLGKHKYKIEGGYSWITDMETFFELCINLGDDHIEIHINNVHELQHALRICGIEKAIIV